jgi:hypothetical protein
MYTAPMVTLYDLLRQRCGLSQQEAADLHAASLDSVKSWCSGRRTAPESAIEELRSLYARIERAAAEGVRTIRRHRGASVVELGLASDDHEAQTLGWPCVGAHAAVLGIVAARSPRPILIVPRGSTAATAKAADAHGL